MDGVGGKPGWAWIFIFEGLATVVAGTASFFIIQDFPDNASFLSKAERDMVIRRLQGDDQFSAGGEKFKLQSVISSLTDWKTWLGSMLGLGHVFKWMTCACSPVHYSSWYVCRLLHASLRFRTFSSEYH